MGHWKTWLNSGEFIIVPSILKIIFIGFYYIFLYTKLYATIWRGFFWLRLILAGNLKIWICFISPSWILQFYIRFGFVYILLRWHFGGKFEFFSFHHIEPWKFFGFTWIGDILVANSNLLNFYKIEYCSFTSYYVLCMEILWNFPPCCILTSFKDNERYKIR